MSLISRIEVTNYLTEGISPHRKNADWRPMLTGLTLRVDCNSALVNITNGGGKSSLTQLILYALSRDTSLLKRMRDKCSPKERGFTHVRIEFRDSNGEDFHERRLFIDPLNVPGETHVIGVALTDDPNDAPIFYAYSGTLEDSPCYERSDIGIASIPDNTFIARTKALRGCKWNRHGSRREWEDQVGLFVSIDVVRRNVKYQLQGSDDQNASLVAVKQKPGESYERAFFRSVVAPDLLSNLLSTWAEENEATVEDTLYLSLSRIVETERSLAKQEKRLEARELKLTELEPVLAIGGCASQANLKLRAALVALRKDAALVHHFGSPESTSCLPGIPRPVSSVRRDREMDPRVFTAIQGLVLSNEQPLLLLDQTLAELSGVDASRLRQLAERNEIQVVLPRTQVVDFACDLVKLSSGNRDGGHPRRAYSRGALTKLVPLLVTYKDAKTDGLAQALGMAFDIAETQLDTNPASRQLRVLQSQLQTSTAAATAAESSAAKLQEELNGLKRQQDSRVENAQAWTDFLEISAALPETLRSEPSQAKIWLDARSDTLRQEAEARAAREATLRDDWTLYSETLDQAGLQGIDSIRTRAGELKGRRDDLARVVRELAQESQRQSEEFRRQTRNGQDSANALAKVQPRLNTMVGYEAGFHLFRTVFGDADPAELDPVEDLKNADKELASHRESTKLMEDELEDLRRLQLEASAFASIFGADSIPLNCNPRADYEKAQSDEALARESVATLSDKVEALDAFDAFADGATPSDWLAKADKERAGLETRSRDLQNTISNARKEIDAIEALSVVENGSFQDAWRVADALGLPAKRLYAVILAANLSEDRRKHALSAFSGLLAAPVLSELAQIQRLGDALTAEGTAVPLLHESALLEALGAQAVRAQGVFLEGPVAGVYSRRVRVLLEPTYAIQEVRRLNATILEFELALADVLELLAKVEPKGHFYGIAVRALEAAQADARVHYARYEREADRARLEVERLSPQVTDTATAVLRAAKEFAAKGGKQALHQQDNTVKARRLHEAEVLQPAADAAGLRASSDNVAAVMSARQYQRLGGVAEHEVLAAQCAQLEEQQETAEEAAGAADERVTEIAKLQQRAEAQVVAFQDEGDGNEMERLQKVLRFDSRADDIAFMGGISAERQKAQLSESAVRNASQVNFARAQSHRQHMNESEEGLALKIAETQVKYEDQKQLAESETSRAMALQNAEIPVCEQSRKDIHALAVSLATRARSARPVVLALNEAAPEEAFPVHAHDLYKHVADAFQGLSRAPFDRKTMDAVLGADVNVSSLDLDAALTGYQQADSESRSTSADFGKAKKDFCDKVRSESWASETALNSLEIEAIESANPERLEGLAELFARLRQTIEADREEAKRSIRIAEQAHEAALGQLASLLRLAKVNLETLEAVMSRYPSGRFFIKAEVVDEERIREFLGELKREVDVVYRDHDALSRLAGKGDETRLKSLLRETIIDKVFINPEVKFKNAGIHGGKQEHMTRSVSTGQMVALEFMWIVRQAEFEIERGLTELSRAQAARSRSRTNRVILVDGMFSSLSDRKLIKEAMNGLRDLGGNFQIIGLLHSANWVNDYEVFPAYLVGKKLESDEGGLVVVSPGRQEGTMAVFSSYKQIDP